MLFLLAGQVPMVRANLIYKQVDDKILTATFIEFSNKINVKYTITNILIYYSVESVDIFVQNALCN